MATFIKEDNSNIQSKPVLKLNKRQKQELVRNGLSMLNPESMAYKTIGRFIDPSYNKKNKGAKTAGLKNDEVALGDAKKIVHTYEKIGNIDKNDSSYKAMEPILRPLKDGIKKTRAKYSRQPQAPKPPSTNNIKPKSGKTPNTEVKPPKPNSLTESYDHEYYDYMEEYSPREIFEMYRNGDKVWVGLINPESYHQALREFTKYGELIRFPKQKVYQWFGTIMRNTAILRTITEIAGHSQYSPLDEFLDVFFYNQEEGDVDYDAWNEYKEEIGEDGNYGAMIEYLDNLNPPFFDWCLMPDGSNPWSDYGIEPLEKIINEYNENKTPEEVLVLLNRALDVAHCRGDLASIFIIDGKQSLTRISEEIKRDKKTVIITEEQLNRLNKILLKEYYKGDLYHSTTLSHLYSILKENCIYANEDCNDVYGAKGTFVSLSRTGNPKLCYSKTKNPCIIRIDSEELMKRTRGAKMKPFNFFYDEGLPKSRIFEFEERFYGDIKYLSGIVKSVDIYINDINDADYSSYCDEVEEFALPNLQSQGIEEPTDKEINMWFLNRILNDFPLFKDKIHIHGNI